VLPAPAEELQDGWVSLDGTTATPTPPSVEVLSSTSSEIVLLVTTPGILCETVVQDTMEFQKITAPGCYHSPDVGYACLPLVGQLIAVPEGAELEVSVAVSDSGDTVYFSDAAVYPTPALVVEHTEEGWEYLVEEFALDEEGYYQSGYHPGDVASVGGEGSLRRQGVARVTVYPLHYDGSTSELVAYPELVVTITCSGGRGGLGEPTGPLSRVAELVLPNYEGGDERVGTPADTGKWEVCTSVADCDTLEADYLMIVEGALMDSVYILAEHRSGWNGYNVAVVSDATVMANADTSAISGRAIRKFISDVYETESAEHMEDGRLGYVLLIGDARSDSPHDLIPAHEVGSVTTDHWYACVRGDDAYADVMIGRLATSHLSEFVTEARKIRYYEVNADSDDEWRQNALLSCGFAWGTGPGCNPGDDGFAASADTALAAANLPGYTVQREHAHGQQSPPCDDQRLAVRQLNVAAVNDGRHLVELCVHGWYHECDTFKLPDANNAANDRKYPFWMAYSCLTGAFDWVPAISDTMTADCLGERLLHNSGEENGAIGYFGATELSSRSAWTYLGSYVWRAFFQHHMHTPGEAIEYAKLWSAAGVGGASDHLMFNLLGDPAIDLFLTDSQGYGTHPDYVVRSTEMSTTPDLVSCGDEIQLTARVRNTSNCRVDDEVKVLFQLCERDGLECSSVDSFFIQVPAWGSEVLESEWTPVSADAGHRRFRVVVDPLNAQPELHEDNNAAMIDVAVLPDATGFPASLEGEGGLSPVVADVDNDEQPEIVAAVRDPGRVSVRSSFGAQEWFFDPPGSQVLRGPVACGDLDGDGTQEVVICHGDTVSARRGVGGTRLWKMRPRGAGLDSGAVLADVHGDDGHLEVLVTRTWDKTGLPKHEQLAVKGTGTGYWWRGPTLDGHSGSPAPTVDTSGGAGDLDGDGLCNAVSTHYETNSVDPSHWLTVLAPSATTTTDSLWSRDLGCDESVQPCDPVFGDVVAGSDGLEVLCGVRSVRCYSRDGDELWDCPVSGYVGGLAVSDLDDDGELETVVPTYGTPGHPDDCAGDLYVLSAEGDTIDSVVLDYAAKAGPVIADLDGGAPEILVTSSCFEYLPSDTMRWVSYLDAFTLTQGILARSDALPRPLLFWGELTSAPCVADVDADSLLEVVLVDGEGEVHCLENESWGTGEASDWVCYQHDERHTGVLETPLTGPYPEGVTASWWGNYLMTGDVTVDGTSSLLVQPGTTVRAVAGADDQNAGVDTTLVELTILSGGGELRVGGDPLRPVVFESAGDPPTAGDWVGIRLRPGSTGVIDDTSISHADQAVDAFKPDMLRVTDSMILESGVRAIKCKGVPDTTVAVLSANTIEGAIIGIELDSCAAEVDANTLTGCSAYGMKIYQDRGSNVHGNQIVRSSYAGGSFSGVYVNGPMADLIIGENAIGDTTTAPSMGIDYELSYSTDVGTIQDNVLQASDDLPCVKGMYFYDAKPVVRRNSLEGEAYYAAFWVAGEGGMRPNLGTAQNGECPETCMDDTPSGCNRIVPESITWCVKVEPGSSNTVMAECNWWGEAYGLFSSVVDHSPSLDGDPWERGEALEGLELGAPLVATLLQNTPNPFNPDTVFRFGLPQASQVRLEIYDFAGRHVRTLLDGPVSVGWQAVAWDGRGDRGERVASGVYFCRLEVGDLELSRKVVVLK
jgi:hypothetical protein